MKNSNPLRNLKRNWMKKKRSTSIISKRWKRSMMILSKTFLIISLKNIQQNYNNE